MPGTIRPPDPTRSRRRSSTSCRNRSPFFFFPQICGLVDALVGVEDDSYCFFHTVGDVQQVHVTFGNLAVTLEGAADPIDESGPVLGTEQDDREARTLVGLNQGECLAALVECSTDPRQENECQS